MKKSRFTDSEIVAVLQEAEDGVAVPALRRAYSIGTETFYSLRPSSAGCTSRW